MRAEIQLGKMALSILLAMNNHQQQGEGPSLFHSYKAMGAGFQQYVEKSKQLQGMGTCDCLGEVTFRGVVKLEDIAQIFDAAARAATTKVSSLQAGLLDLLQPALHWKDGFCEETQLDEVLTQAATTIMTVKGKRLHTQALSLLEAGPCHTK